MQVICDLGEFVLLNQFPHPLQIDGVDQKLRVTPVRRRLRYLLRIRRWYSMVDAGPIPPMIPAVCTLL